jgi:GntR family transcriptional repressor for pyruvate dehydrogenase complex
MASMGRSYLTTTVKGRKKRAAAQRVELGIKRVPRMSVCEEVAQQVMNLVANGDLKPGQRLPAERELCEQFGVGRSSLREALRCLSIMGVLDARVGNGTSVAKDGSKFLSKVCEWRLLSEQDDLENLMETRIALEGATAANVAAIGTPEQIQVLGELIDAMAAETDNGKRFGALDIQFHLKLAEASGNKLLLDLITILRNQLAQGLRRVLLLPHALPLSHKEHVAIFKAIKQRDSVAARDKMQAHLQAALTRYRTERLGRNENSSSIR